MANKKLFGSAGATIEAKTVKKFGVAKAVNSAGGKAYSLDDQNALAQLAVTGTFNNTFYVSGEAQLVKIKELADKCSDSFIAKLAIYARRFGAMKDTPAFLLAILAKRNSKLAEQIFSRVINNQKMLRNFVQIVRSGQVGSKSFGTVMKRAIQTWLAKQSADNLFRSAVGNDPSLADVVKMAHPKGETLEKQTFYKWLLNKPYDHASLPAQVALFERFKKGDYSEIPVCDFRMLTPFLNKDTWTKVALAMPWNALRMNLNTFQRHGVFEDKDVLMAVNMKLQDKEAVQKSNAFPYQILTTVKALQGESVPAIYLALEQAMEYATENVPEFKGGNIAVCVDVSGSMSWSISGRQKTGGPPPSKTKCVDVAALIASCVLRKNPGKTQVLPFDATTHAANLNPNDSVFNNAAKLASYGGGATDCACALRKLNSDGWKGDTVIFVSDNESWYGKKKPLSSWQKVTTDMAEEWTKLKLRNPKAKLVCIDVAPGATTQVPNLPKEVLNIGGFSDTVFEIVASFVNGDDRSFAQVIDEEIDLTGWKSGVE